MSKRSTRGKLEYYESHRITSNLVLYTLVLQDVERAYDLQRKENVGSHDAYKVQIREEHVQSFGSTKVVHTLVTQGPTAGSRRYRTFETYTEAFEHAQAWARRRYRYTQEVAA